MANAQMDFLYGVNSTAGDMSYPMSFAPREMLEGKASTVNDVMVSQQPAIFVSDTDKIKYNVGNNGVPDPSYREENLPKMPGIYKPRNSEIPSSGGKKTGAEAPKYTEKQVDMYGKSLSYLVSAASDFINGNLAYDNAKMREKSYEFRAEQNERAARLLEMNIRDINLAAQMDASVYKMQGRQTKSAQKVAMASSGFAVGKGSYSSTLTTTDARTNYNIGIRMLKADLQTAETYRKIGTYKAQAEIAKGNAKIAKVQGEAAKHVGNIQGFGNLINSGISFYVGNWGLSGAESTTTKTKSGGKK